ncbi:hypothetical protein QTG54_010024 [Skeletonema marinoi]|uniref:Uncharacterized protein n=1 Tax=Skeletonema marinoi TaxID=267567 RepID=A0AAD9D9S8_9STRA|nr:hypothetical protein QTG54_010024 [Skeletonema marinoi]
MLLRDDIILTTHECSQSPAFFEFISGSGVFLEAAPHTALNAIMGLHHLGFLLAKDAPWHYLFLDRPVRRARMFLSLRSKPSIADDHDARAVPPYITCKGYRPIAHNFPLPNGEMIPIGEELLKVDLPKDLILWEHADLESAPELKNDKGERWWTKAITLEEGEEEFQGYFETPKIKGPEGSISVVRAHTDFIGKAGGISEAFDPRGHRRNVCFCYYLIRWKTQQPFSGMHFFDWLDYGSGKLLFEMNKKYNFLPDVVHENCVKKYFNAKTVHYFNATEREAYEIYLSSAKDGQEVMQDTSKATKRSDKITTMILTCTCLT